MPEKTAETILKHLEWSVFRRLDGLLQGNYRTLFKGSGLDLADLREYELHDDVRAIDWNVTARLQTPYVREYNEDREITAWFLCDLTSSLDFGSAEKTKREMLTDFVASISLMLMRGGNRIGALVDDGNEVHYIPSRAGRRQILELTHRILQFPATTATQATDLTRLIESARCVIRRRSLVFLISDFHSAPGWSGPLGSLAMKNEILAVRIFDPLEMNIPDLGILSVADSETGDQMIVDSGNKRFRNRFAEITSTRVHELRNELAAAGVDALELATNDDLVESIVRFVRIKNYRSSRTAENII